MVFFKKNKTKADEKVAKPKNVTKEFIDGKEVAPKTIPDLEIPIPPPEEIAQEKPLTAEEVFAEGRSVGFQEGMIYAINLCQDHLQQHQEELKKKLQEVKP